MKKDIIKSMACSFRIDVYSTELEKTLQCNGKHFHLQRLQQKPKHDNIEVPNKSLNMTTFYGRLSVIQRQSNCATKTSSYIITKLLKPELARPIPHTTCTFYLWKPPEAPTACVLLAQSLLLPTFPFLFTPIFRPPSSLCRFPPHSLAQLSSKKGMLLAKRSGGQPSAISHRPSVITG